MPVQSLNGIVRLGLSKRSIFMQLQPIRAAARVNSICFANAKKSGRVPRSAAEKPRKDSADFFHFWREKVSVLELSDDFGTARGPFLLVGETVVSPTA